MAIRGSMEKFQWSLSEPHRIGVVQDGLSRPYTYGSLNKQFVLLLTALGIPRNTFLDLEQKFLQELNCLKSDLKVAVRYCTVFTFCS